MMNSGTDQTEPLQVQHAQAPMIRSAAVTLVGSVVGAVMVISGEVLAARVLHGPAYGLYASGITVARIGEALSVFGLPVGIFHFIPIYRQRSETRLLIGTAYAAALLPLLIGGLFAAAVWLTADWLGRTVFKSVEVVPYIRVLAFAPPFIATAEILGAITRGFGHAKHYVVVKNLTPPFVFLISLALMSYFKAPPIWIAGAVVSAGMIACGAGVAAVVRVVGPDLWRVAPDLQFGALYRYSAEIMLNSIFYLVFAVSGILTVGMFLGSDSVGIYRMCLQIVVPFEMIVLAFHAAMGPVYPVLARENRITELEDAYGTAVRWMAMLHLPIGIALAWNRDDLLALLSPRFSAGSTALLILAVGFSTFMCFGTGAYLLMLSGRKSVETRNSACAAALNVVLAVVLVPRLGLAGAAFATAVSFVLLNIIRILEVRYTMGVRTFRPYFIRIAAVSVAGSVSALAGLRVAGVLQGSDAVSLALRITATGLVHVLALWTIGLNSADKTALKTLARSAVTRSTPALSAT